MIIQNCREKLSILKIQKQVTQFNQGKILNARPAKQALDSLVMILGRNMRAHTRLIRPETNVHNQLNAVFAQEDQKIISYGAKKICS